MITDVGLAYIGPQNGDEVELFDPPEIMSTGWIPSLPDFRDLSENSPEVLPFAESMGLTSVTENELPRKIDLRKGFSPVEQQGNIGSCTAHGGMGLIEFMERKAYGRHINGSRRFLYKVTRKLLGWEGDTGALCRATMGAMCLFGVPPEKYWPYDTTVFDEEPPPFVYAMADNFEALKYFRHDPSGGDPRCTLISMKKYLASGIPCMFGFYGFPSFSYTDIKGGIPYPGKESAKWAHAICGAGYDDDMEIRNTKYGTTTRGALIIRNSWGAWGDKGYGYLPYQYVLDKLAWDVWSLISMKWVNTKNFGL